MSCPVVEVSCFQGTTRVNVFCQTDPVSETLCLLDFRTLEMDKVQWQQEMAVQSNLGSRKPRIMNNSVYEQIFQTQSYSDDILCLELWTCKPSTLWSDKLEVSVLAVFVEEWSSGKYRVSNTDRRERQLLCSFHSLEFTVPSLVFQCFLFFL
jgi:hypothetical protein